MKCETEKIEINHIENQFEHWNDFYLKRKTRETKKTLYSKK